MVCQVAGFVRLQAGRDVVAQRAAALAAMGFGKSPKERAKAQKERERKQATRARQDAATRSEQQAAYNRDRRAPDEEATGSDRVAVAQKSSRKKQQGADRVARRAMPDAEVGPNR